MKPFRRLLSLALTALLSVSSGCAQPHAAEPAPEVDHYTCTMHPSVRLKDPGQCPICGMTLVAVKSAGPGPETTAAETSANPNPGAGTADSPREFTVPTDRQQMFGVTYATAALRPLRRTLRTVGMVAATTAKHWDYVSRVDGYIHDLKVSAPGDPVKKGQVLLDLYSPDLVATENEYLDLGKMLSAARAQGNPAAVANADRLRSAARARLQQWNISDDQIESMGRSGRAEEYLPLTSPVDGVIEEVVVHQGRHIGVGDHLVDLVDLSSVWVWAEVYEDELPLVKAGLPVTITGAGLLHRTLHGQVAAIDPFLNPQTRTARVRIDLPNPGGWLRPDAYVDVSLELDGGTALAIPLGAILPTGERNIVFVDKGAGRLEPRLVELGGKYGDYYRVTAGLRPGERVVTSANFLIDAESKVQGALKDF